MLKNLRLRPDALAELDLPVTVRAGLLGSLTLKVCWLAAAGAAGNLQLRLVAATCEGLIAANCNQPTISLQPAAALSGIL